MKKNTATLAAAAIVFSTAVLTACEDLPECVEYETVYVTKYYPSAPNYRVEPQKICAKYATEKKDNR